MNILPPNNDGNISIKPYTPPVIQNNRSFNLSKRKTPLKSMSTDTTKVDEEKKHINDLSKRLPELTSIFNLHHKIGEGSFSSVFLASLKCHEHLPQDQRKFYAIKHLVPTSHPSRIEQELRCLKYIGGCENVVGLDFCMRKYDTVIFVMPYLPHTKFSEYVLKMDVMETKVYIKNLLLALRRVHQFHIIHRDVKPSNFLYDRINRRFLLVDFGLAQKIDRIMPTNGLDQKTISVENSSIDSLSENRNGLANLEPHNSQTVNGRKRKFNDLNEGQTASGELESNPKRALIDLTIDNAPLKPLQGDHPKISPSVSMPLPIRSQEISPKLAAVKRQVFVDDNENPKRMAVAPNDRIANVAHPTDSVQSLDLNNFSNASSTTNLANYNNLLQNTYQLSNYPICANALELQKLAQYYNYYNALNYNSLLANNMYIDGSNLSSHKSLHTGIDYNLYRSQLNSHLLQNNLMNYNNMYACHSKITQSINNGVYNAGQHLIPSVVKPPVKEVKPKQVPLDNSAQVSVKHEALSKNGSKKSGSTLKLCGCGGRPSVCSICLGRGAYNAPRAGTQGFRPPEVLLKYTEQTTAVDLWACGVILLSVVSGCYPFFRAPDDLTALAEMVTLFGSRPLKNVANTLGRHLMCSHTRRPLDLRKLCSHLRYRALKTNSAGNSELVKSTIFELQQDKVPIENMNGRPDPNLKTGIGSAKNVGGRKYAVNSKCPKGGKKMRHCPDCTLPLISCVCAPESNQSTSLGSNINANTNWCGFPDEAFDLLERLLDLNPHTRITASEALLHPFLSDS